MDSSDWLQGSIHEECSLDSSSPSGDMLNCSRHLMERRIRPPHDVGALKCPRCDSTQTKFCYYNNYSLSQPRYFCKTCRRYWTKGGTLRNIPVGGVCRKHKKVSSKKSSDHHSITQNPGSSSHHNPTDLQLSFPEMQFSNPLGNILGTHGTLANPNFLLENPSPIDFTESKLEAIVCSSRNYEGNGLISNLSHHHHELAPNVHNLCSLDGNGSTFIDTCQRLMVPYDHANEDQTAMDVKPNANELLSLDWQNQAGCSDVGYLGNLGSPWSGMINGYGSSATNSLF